MSLTIGEKIKVIMNRQGMNMTDLAEKTKQTRQNLSNKMARDNFTERETRAMADALGVEVETRFRFPDGTII